MVLLSIQIPEIRQHDDTHVNECLDVLVVGPKGKARVDGVDEAGCLGRVVEVGEIAGVEYNHHSVVFVH
jgi:hypothetical protein